MSCDFTTTSYGKFILAGEHAVLRGCPAIVFPVKSRGLTLTYTATDEPVHAGFEGSTADELHLLFWSVLEQGLEMINKPIGDIRGRFQIDTNIPIGACMGASATLCVATGRWFVSQGLIKEDELHEFSCRLEDLFHGESSGLDIAVVIAEQGLYFERNGTRKTIQSKWQPQWYLSSSEQLCKTSDCINKVKKLWESNVELAKRIDEEMQESALDALEALQLNEERGYPILRDAINKAANCFREWGLAQGKVDTHINALLRAGACAVKPTGSGDGGHVLSLWKQAPPQDLAFDLISL